MNISKNNSSVSNDKRNGRKSEKKKVSFNRKNPTIFEKNGKRKRKGKGKRKRNRNRNKIKAVKKNENRNGKIKFKRTNGNENMIISRNNDGTIKGRKYLNNESTTNKSNTNVTIELKRTNGKENSIISRNNTINVPIGKLNNDGTRKVRTITKNNYNKRIEKLKGIPYGFTNNEIKELINNGEFFKYGSK